MYSLYRLKKLTKNIYKTLVEVEAMFTNTENSKTSKSNKFIYQFFEKLDLKNQNNKNIGLARVRVRVRVIIMVVNGRGLVVNRDAWL